MQTAWIPIERFKETDNECIFIELGVPWSTFLSHYNSVSHKVNLAKFKPTHYFPVSGIATPFLTAVELTSLEHKYQQLVSEYQIERQCLYSDQRMQSNRAYRFKQFDKLDMLREKLAAIRLEISERKAPDDPWS